LARRVQAALEVERAEQTRLMTTNDFREGVDAAAARRPPVFSGN
jgi:enoyl-CoA hydratase/carnithine racemase